MIRRTEICFDKKDGGCGCAHGHGESEGNSCGCGQGEDHVCDCANEEASDSKCGGECECGGQHSAAAENACCCGHTHENDVGSEKRKGKRMLFIHAKNGVRAKSLLGALVGLDIVPYHEFVDILNRMLPEKEFELDVTKKDAGGVAVHCVSVVSAKDAQTRTVKQIKQLLGECDVDDQTVETLIAALKPMYEALAQMQGKQNIEDIELGVLGGIESLAAMAGCAILLSELDIDFVVSDAVDLGCGTVGTGAKARVVPSTLVTTLFSGCHVTFLRKGEATDSEGAAVMYAALGAQTDKIEGGVLVADACGCDAKTPNPKNILRATVLEIDTDGDKLG